MEQQQKYLQSCYEKKILKTFFSTACILTRASKYRQIKTLNFSLARKIYLVHSPGSYPALPIKSTVVIPCIFPDEGVTAMSAEHPSEYQLCFPV